MGTQLKDLLAAGQSIWLDNIRRNMFATGELARSIEGGLRGMTSNPTIFEKAIGAGSDYDAQLRELVGSESDPNHLFEALAIDDIRHACDAFRALYDSTKGGDGFVSIEVSPLLANDTSGTIDAAERLWKMVDRPNVMIKIPGTNAGLPAIEATIAKGINVNVTLIFSLETYDAVANAYIAGLEKRKAAGGSLERIASVASVFVSRIDTAVDKLLEERIAAGDESLAALPGTIGVANLKLIYARFKKIFEGSRFAPLRAAGAHPQRPLWASTGTKNPKYSDLLYVESLVAKETVNTVPPATLDALLDHGKIVPDTAERDLDGAHAAIDALAKAKISLYDVTQKLQVEGVDSFAKSYNDMLAAIAKKRDQLRGDAHTREMSLGKVDAGLEPAIEGLVASDFLTKLWKHDPTPWTSAPEHEAIIKNALGWLDFPATVRERADELIAFGREVAKSFDHAVVLGMGGSSLAPDVLRATFGRVAGHPQLHVLDSSDPEQIRSMDAAIDIRSTLFIVASKSGTTTEPQAFFSYYYDRVAKAVGSTAAGKAFVAITDPGTSLVDEAKAAGFLRVFENDPAIGGRYSALSYFSMVPAAVAGYDVAAILDRGLDTLAANGRTTSPREAPGVRIGAAFGTLAKAGRDKLTIVAHPAVSAFGAWAEQLVAESTGKGGRGIVPIEGEPLGEPGVYGSDRTFVYVGDGLPDAPPASGAQSAREIEGRLAALEGAGHPVIRLPMADRDDIGAQFALWEIAIATAGSILEIDAFDQPNVQESKDNTKRLLADYKRTGTFGEGAPAVTSPHATVLPLSGSRDLHLGGDDLERAIAALIGQVRPGDYVAFTAYVERDDDHEARLRDIRIAVRDALRVATTVGFGPRFLHSTGQLHKGGPNTGVFFQLTIDTPADRDLAIPGMSSFGTLLRAQALGDFESLDKRDRRGARIHLVGNLDAALDSFRDAVDGAVSAHA